MLQLLLCVDCDGDDDAKKSLPLNNNNKKAAYKLDDWVAKCYNDYLIFLNADDNYMQKSSHLVAAEDCRNFIYGMQ